MTENNDKSGRIRKKSNPFSQVSNYALRDNTLSLKAKGMYALIQSYIDIPNFILYKSTLAKNCIEGKSAFDATWKELKDKGYLKQEKITTPKGYLYEYELLDIPDNKSQDPENQGVGFQEPENQPLGNSSVEESDSLNKLKENKNDLKNNNPLFIQTLSPNTSKEGTKEIPNPYPNLNSNYTVYDEIINNCFTGKYTYFDYVNFVKQQLNFDFIKNFAFYAGENNKEEATLEWVYLLADLYLSKDKEIIINGSKRSMGIVKQKLLLITPNTMIGIFQNYEKILGQQAIKNPKNYMISSLLNAHSSAGITANLIEEKTF